MASLNGEHLGWWSDGVEYGEVWECDENCPACAEDEWEDDDTHAMPPKERFPVTLNIVSVRKGRLS